MPTVFLEGNIRFFFYSNEGSPSEPVHIHAHGPQGSAKLWISPTVRFAYSDGFTTREKARLLRAVEAKQDMIVRAWNEHFG